MHYRINTGGSRSKPIVFFHMTSDTSESYENIMAALDGQVTTIAFDTPNYGESFRTNRTPSIDYISDVFIEALDALGVEQFHGYGHHTGASIALHLAHQHPTRALSATLNGMVAVTEEEGRGYMDTLVWPNPPNDHGGQVLAAWTRALTLEPHYLDFPAEIKNRVVRTMLQAGTDWSWAYRAVFNDDAASKLTTVQRPLFFVIGRFDASLDLHTRAAESRPDSASHISEEFGMFYCENAPEDLAPRLLAFVQGAEKEKPTPA
ncbi:MAG: hypothetical protein C0482_22155 [Gordonia sp.]|nr:hypothetical protein [Gordonia sp. (in: high G+C Gram-positive bacteria)]